MTPPMSSPHSHSHSAYDTQSQSEEGYTCSISDKNSTVDNQAGPGRAIDNLYGYLGLRLELFLGKVMVKMGKGPIATAKRIRRNRAEVIAMTTWHHWYCGCSDCRLLDEFSLRDKSAVIRSSAKLKALHRKTNKDCKRLVGYIDSSQPSTQRQAVESILGLSTCDGEIRAMLKGHGARAAISTMTEINSRFRSKNREADIAFASSSRKALVSLGDGEINMLLKKWVGLTRPYRLSRGSGVEAEIKTLWNKISPYLRDTERAFLVIRILRSSLPGWDDSHSSMVLSSIKDSPVHFEWTECEAMLCMLWDPYFYPLKDTLELIYGWLFEHADQMPRVFQTDAFTWSTKDTDSILLWGHSATQLSILNGIRRDIDEKPSLSTLRSRYTSQYLQPLLNYLVCPVVRVVRNFVLDDILFHIKVPGPKERDLYDVLVRFINDPDGTVQTNAWSYIDYFLKHDMYRCDMLLSALSQTAFSPPEGVTAFIEAKRRQCVPEGKYEASRYYRHFDSRGNVHVENEVGDCLCDESVERELMEIPGNWTLDVKVKHGEAFSSTGLFPLVVGYDIHKGPICLAETLLATCCTELVFYPTLLITIRDGTRPEDIRVGFHCPHGKVLAVPGEFEVPVLRYAPEAYAEVLGVDAESLFTKGPFSWKPVQTQEVHDRDSKRCGYRVLTIEEARESGYSEEDIYPGDGERHLPCWEAYLRESEAWIAPQNSSSTSTDEDSEPDDPSDDSSNTNESSSGLEGDDEANCEAGCAVPAANEVSDPNDPLEDVSGTSQSGSNLEGDDTAICEDVCAVLDGSMESEETSSEPKELDGATEHELPGTVPLVDGELVENVLISGQSQGQWKLSFILCLITAVLSFLLGTHSEKIL